MAQQVENLLGIGSTIFLRDYEIPYDVYNRPPYFSGIPEDYYSQNIRGIELSTPVSVQLAPPTTDASGAGLVTIGQTVH